MGSSPLCHPRPLGAARGGPAVAPSPAGRVCHLALGPGGHHRVCRLPTVGAGEQRHSTPRRAVLITSGGYAYNPRMRKAFLDGPGKEGWAFYGSPANTGDGIRMALKIGAALSKIGSVAGRVICAIPERRSGLKIGLNTSSVGKPHAIVVDHHGRRYAAERRITKDPS